MTADPRAALARLVTAFERHLEAASTRRGEEDPTVIAAYEDLADAFEEYDGALYDAYGEMTPLDLYTDDDDDDTDGGDGDDGGDRDDDGVGDHEDEDGDRSGIYSGLDDDYDEDDEDD